MPSQEEIDQQLQRLAVYRRTLATYLDRQARLGKAYAPPEVSNGIREARDEIRRIKNILRSWSVNVENHPDDINAEQPQRAQIFISYKRNIEPDQTVAHDILAALEGAHDIFIDHTMLVGEPWVERIKTEISRADYLIVFLSAYAVRSEMVELEIATAHDLAQAQGGRPRLLPVRLDYREPFQYPLNQYLDRINWAIWSGPQDTPQLIADLKRAIEGEALAIDSAVAKKNLLQVSQAALPAPLPSAQPAALEFPEGTMIPDSPFYIDRPVDTIALRTIEKPGSLLTIKGPRQMGKSSLLIRAIASARRSGRRVVFLDFQLFDRRTLADGDRFFRQFSTWLTGELELSNRLDEYWIESLGNTQRCTRYVAFHVLKEIGEPLILAMDEVEKIFESDFRSDFFGMLRHWYNSRALNPIWNQLSLALVTSTEPYQLVSDLNSSPFNVGTVVELADFVPEQVADLNRRHNTPLNGAEQEQILKLLHGHPYLTRRALYLISSQSVSTADLFRNASADNGPFGDHLRYHLFRLHDKPELKQELLRVIRTNTVSDEKICWRLLGAGLVRRSGNKVVPRCELYASYFREHLHE